MRSPTFSGLPTCPLAEVQRTKRCRSTERLNPLPGSRTTGYTSYTGHRRCPIYKVLIDDNFHYQDESERVTHGVFGPLEEALAACRRIVDEFLAGGLEPGMSPAALYERYTMFGDDPFVVPVDPKDAPVSFSAWEYARQRCEEMAGSIGAGESS